MSTPPKVKKPHHPKILQADREANGDFLSKEQEELIHRWLKNPIENWLEQNKGKWGGTTGISKDQWLAQNPLQKLGKKDKLVIVDYVQSSDPSKGKIRQVTELGAKLKYSLIFPEDGRVYAVYRGKEPNVAATTTTTETAERKQALGKGAYGTVKLGRLIERDEQVAVKNRAEGIVNLVAIKISEFSSGSVNWKRAFERDARAFQKAEKKGNRRMLRKTKQGTLKGYVIMELGANSLKEYFPKIKNYEERLEIALACMKSLKELQDAGLIHRDIKGPNILYNPETKEVRIVDMGIYIDLERSKKFTEKRKIKGQKGNFSRSFGVDFYHSPVMQGRDYSYWGQESQSDSSKNKPYNPPRKNQFSKKTDIYSMGYMFSGPFDFKLLAELDGDSTIPDTQKEILQTELQILINAMTSINPFKRPTIEQCIYEMQVIINLFKALKEGRPVAEFQNELEAMRGIRWIPHYIYVDEMIQDFKDPLRKELCILRIKAINPKEIQSNFDLMERVLQWTGPDQAVIAPPAVIKEVFQTLLEYGAPYVPPRFQDLDKTDDLIHSHPGLTALLALQGFYISVNQFLELFKTPDCRPACLALLQKNAVSGSSPNSQFLIQRLDRILNTNMGDDSHIILFKEIISEKPHPWPVAPSPELLKKYFLNPPLTLGLTKEIIKNHIINSFEHYTEKDKIALIRVGILFESMPDVVKALLNNPKTKIFYDKSSPVYKAFAEAMANCTDKELNALWLEKGGSILQPASTIAKVGSKTDLSTEPRSSSPNEQHTSTSPDKTPTRGSPIDTSSIATSASKSAKSTGASSTSSSAAPSPKPMDQRPTLVKFTKTMGEPIPKLPESPTITPLMNTPPGGFSVQENPLLGSTQKKETQKASGYKGKDTGTDKDKSKSKDEDDNRFPPTLKRK